MAKKRVTSDDVARAAGVSRTTVSFVLNNVASTNISETTKQRVRDAAQKLDYVPNAAARSLAQGMSPNIGIALIDSHQQVLIDSYFSAVLTGLGEIVRQHSFRLLFDWFDNSQQQQSLLKMLHGHEVAGMIVYSPRGKYDFWADLTGQDLPIVAIGDELPPEVPYVVGSDNMAGIKKILGHLIELGHRRIAYISYAPADSFNYYTERRLATYLETLQEAGISPDKHLIRYGNYELQTGYQAMQELLALKQLPTAVFGMNDSMAIGAMTAIKEVGLRVPEDIAVVGFDDESYASFTEPPLTTIRQAPYEVGLAAGKMLVDLINDIEPEYARVKLPVDLVIRESSSVPK